jgi:hypothetical protein
MLERAIENWLISAGEKQYQSPFCQVLMSQGHCILRVSKHRSSEEGKDICSVASNGGYHAYQLKDGDIDVREWWRIRDQLVDLVSMPIKHARVDRARGHSAHLVTNGRLADEVHQRIVDFNRDNEEKHLGYATLDVIERDELISLFVDAQDRFVPVAPEELQRLLSIYLAPGNDLLDTKALWRVLRDGLFSEADPKPARARNALTAGVVMLSYLLRPYQVAENHFAVFQAWAVLRTLVEEFALRVRVSRSVLETTRALILQEMQLALERLKKETIDREDYLEGDLRGDGGLMYRARTTLALGAAAALEVQSHRADAEHIVDASLVRRIARERDGLWYWGDSAFPYHFAIVRCLELGGESPTAREHLATLLTEVLASSVPESQSGLPNVYYDVQGVLVASLGLASLERDARPYDFSSQSWSLSSLVFMCARRGMRELIERHWKDISRVQVLWYEPPDPISFWQLLPERGSNQSRHFAENQSWRELERLANQPTNRGPIWKAGEPWLLYFLLLRPERAINQVVSVLDGAELRTKPARKKRAPGRPSPALP